MANNIKAAVPFILGFVPSIVGTTTSTYVLNSAAKKLAFGFRVPASGVGAKLRAFINTKTGAPSSSEIKLDICADNGSGQPAYGTILETSTTTGGHTTNAWSEWTLGGATTYSVGVQYWAVFTNTNAAPATNSVTFRVMGAGRLPTALAGSDAHQGWGKWESSDTGATWITAVAAGAAIRLEFTGSLFSGFPYSAVAASADAIYGTRLSGVLFTVPATYYPTLNIAGVALGFGSPNNSPATDVDLFLYTSGASPSLVATTTGPAGGSLPNGMIAAGTPDFLTAYFSTPQALTAGTSYRIVAGLHGASGGDASNYHRLVEYTVDNDANSRALVALAGQKTYFDGTNWTDTNTAVLPFYLIPNRDGEFTLPAGGGGASGTAVLTSGRAG